MLYHKYVLHFTPLKESTPLLLEKHLENCHLSLLHHQNQSNKRTGEVCLCGKSSQVSHRCENCTITFTPLLSLLSFLLIPTTFADVGTVTVRNGRNKCPKT